MSDGLQLAGKTVLVTGVANKKSVALHIGRGLQERQHVGHRKNFLLQ